MNEVPVSPPRILRFLAVIIVGLACANLIAHLLFRIHLESPRVHGLVPLFNMDAEANIPAFFSAVLLLACSLLLAVIAVLRRRQGAPWTGSWASLSLVFAYLSLDESASIHELFNEPVRGALGTTGAFYFAWVIPAMVIVAVLGAIYLRFVLALPLRTRRLFILSAVLYVGGALGVEMAGSWWVSTRGWGSPVYVLLVTAEESLEMFGAATFIYTLLSYLQSEYGSFQVRLGRGTPPDSAAWSQHAGLSTDPVPAHANGAVRRLAAVTPPAEGSGCDQSDNSDA